MRWRFASRRNDMRTLHLFAGAGGGLLADLILGHDPVGYVEIDDYCQRVIAARIKDGALPEAPIFGDIRTFNREGFAGSYTGLVDIIAGGFPCQDISVAGKGKGIDGERSGLWGEMVETVRIIKPRFVFVENSPALTFRGMGKVLGDLAGMGFDARWGIVSAHEAGASCLRKRMWIMASTIGFGRIRVEENKKERRTNIDTQGFEQWKQLQDDLRIPMDVFFYNPMRGVVRNDDGVAVGMDRLKAVGNGQCPQQAALAWRILSQ
jgi:DNA (cytosine-5)-methyltransferase 1